MPEICRFFGIIIAMFYDEHNPPHFHARYGKDGVAIEINSLRVLEGRIPPRALGLVMEWALQHKKELLNNWELAKKNQPPKKIAPLA
ncbi:MAG: DUF4160 domain-containing protein [Deltaproteobacteria bacterium]|nr:DUF4160 domain-containing protein [Deltaproteobacteria bacterium]